MSFDSERPRRRAADRGGERTPTTAPGSEPERRHARRTFATFGVSEEDGERIHLCQAEDIALGGITIKHAPGLSHEPHTEVALRFALPGSTEQIEARGEIVSDAKVGRFRRTGVRFTDVQPEHQQLIAAYCRRR